MIFGIKDPHRFNGNIIHSRRRQHRAHRHSWGLPLIGDEIREEIAGGRETHLILALHASVGAVASKRTSIVNTVS